jgi:hypothetical protein
MKKAYLYLIIIILMIPEISLSATLKFSANFDNKSYPTYAYINNYYQGGIVYWGGTGQELSAILGKEYQWVTGRSGTGYALQGVINNAEGTGTGTWPYLNWWPQENWPTNELYISFWMKYVNYVRDENFKPYENIKLHYSYFSQGGGNSPSNEWGVTTPSPPANEYYWQVRDVKNVDQGSGWISANDMDGGWHHYEWLYNFSTKNVKMWIDSNLKIDHTNTLLGWNGFVRNLEFGSLVGTGPNSKGTRAFDDIEVWDGKPGTTSSILPPSSKAPTPPKKLMIQ